MSRELSEFLASHAVNESTTVETDIGPIEIVALNAGHLVDLSNMSGVEFSLAVAALSLAKDGKRHSDTVGFATALKQVKALDIKVALKIGMEAIRFNKIGEEAVEESGKD